MLTGKQLGAAIRKALELKKARAVDLAAHFDVKPPSVQGWLKNGTVAKDRLPELWRFFSDVVGPEHWGLEAWPQAVGTEGGPTPDEMRLLEDFRVLTLDDQSRVRQEVSERATKLREYLQQQLGRKSADESLYNTLVTRPTPRPVKSDRKSA